VTKELFREGLARYDILHFAGHSVLNPGLPASSFLALAPSGQDSGILYLRELDDLPAPASRLVVLSACSTVLGDSRGAEGLTGLARPFLAAGVPAVVGSLWRIDDSAAAVLFREFHHRLQEGMGTAEALRQAQLMMLRNSDRRLRAPASWAGIELIGADI
jgi:CHAT domain-containing protein